jgi:hypothetical protein
MVCILSNVISNYLEGINMTKNSTKQLKKLLKELPTLTTSASFIQDLKDRIKEEEVGPEWDQVQFED